jgi:hypothetical protein
LGIASKWASKVPNLVYFVRFSASSRLACFAVELPNPSLFGLRPSGFFRASGFGLRISGPLSSGLPSSDPIVNIKTGS